MEDALYWTASTIAQTLAGAMALMGAFMLCRFQMMDMFTHECAQKFIDSFGTRAEFSSAREAFFRDGNIRQVVEARRARFSPCW